MINPGPHSENCIVLRPNSGKAMWTKDTLKQKCLASFPDWRAEGNVNRALEVWKRE